MEEYTREDIEFFVRDKMIKGLPPQYIIEAVFDAEMQAKWHPWKGDIIMGSTGNIFVIGGHQHFHPSVGGDVFFFGGDMAARGGCTMNTPTCYTMNIGGRFMMEGEKQEGEYFPSHCSWKKMRFIPYPHETGRMSESFKNKIPSLMGNSNTVKY